MKKIGIMSMQRIKNYGSFLQAYALKRIIESLGDYKVEFVDYRIEEPIINDNKNSQGILNKLIDALKGDGKLIHKIQYIIYKNNFNKYLKKLDLINDNFNPILDTLVIGSDEVFNIIQANKNVGYSLELFGKDNRAKKVITYAASFGNTTLEKIKHYRKENEISSLLKRIDSISVRDKNSYDIVNKLTNLKPIINMDPVLMFDYMNSGLIPNIETKEKYMILYAYNNRISIKEAKKIKEIAKEQGIKVYSIGGSQPYADRFIDCTPFEVLSYFKNAEYIITDTFHGSIFSIINNKQFVTLVRRSKEYSYGNEEKLTYLLESLYLKDRTTYSLENLEELIKKKIDFTKTNEIIKKNREDAINYLKENL